MPLARGNGKWIRLINNMEKGDSVVVTEREFHCLHTSFSRMKVKYQSRKVEDRPGYRRVWRTS